MPIWRAFFHCQVSAAVGMFHLTPVGDNLDAGMWAMPTLRIRKIGAVRIFMPNQALALVNYAQAALLLIANIHLQSRDPHHLKTSGIKL